LDNPFHVYGVVVGRQLDASLTCIDNWSVEYNIDPVTVATVYDNFNRASLGSGLVATGSPAAALQNNEICADVQAMTYSTHVFTDPVTIDYYYTALDPNDWESYAVGLQDPSTADQTNIVLMGMDSGTTLRASYGNVAYTHISVTDTQMPKTVDLFYHIVAFASNSIIAVDLRTFDDRLIASNSFDVSPQSLNLKQFGLLVGRTSNSKYTCGDNLAIQAQPLYGGTNGMNAGSLATLSSMAAVVLGAAWLFLALVA